MKSIQIKNWPQCTEQLWYNWRKKRDWWYDRTNDM